MRFRCPACARALGIPDEKLPPVERFLLNCPCCKEKFVIDKTGAATPAWLVDKPPEPLPIRPVLEDASTVRPGLEDALAARSSLKEEPIVQPSLEEEPGLSGAGLAGISHGPSPGGDMAGEPAPPPEFFSGMGSTSPAPSPASPPASPPEPPAAQVPASGGTGEPEIFPPGSRVAFLFLADGGWTEGARTFFRERGYYVSTAADAGEAAAKLRLNAYDVLLLEDNDQGRALLAEAGSWPGVRRRECNVALAGEGAASLDPQQAFRLGVNSWLNKGDAARCGELLEEVLKGYELYYELLRTAQGKGGEE